MPLKIPPELLAEAKLLYGQLPGRKPFEKLDCNQLRNWLIVARFTLAREKAHTDAYPFGGSYSTDANGWPIPPVAANQIS